MIEVPPTLAGPRLLGPDDDWEPYIGYIRVSTWKEEKISPELQQAAIEAWAARTRRRIVDWVPDLDMTGRNFNRRIMECIERTERREVRGVAVWKFSRFGRSRDGIALNLKRLEDAGGQLLSATEEADARTATGRLQRGILFEFAAYESDVRGEQWRETHDHRKYKLHLPACGKPRFGYLWTPRRVPDATSPTGWRLQEESYRAHPEQGPVMADRYRQYLAGDAFYALVCELNSAGWRTTRRGMWSVQTLIRYMDSGFPAGLLRVHTPKCPCVSNRSRCPNMVYIPGAQDELISADLWQQYQERRAEVAAIPPRARPSLYVLSSLQCCGLCHGTAPAHPAVQGPAGAKVRIRGYSYQCGRRATGGLEACRGVFVRRSVAEAAVRRWVKSEAAAGVDAATASPVPAQRQADRREAAARERERLQGEADRLAKALTTLRVQRAADPDDWGPGEYEAARDRIRKEQATVTAALEVAVVAAAVPRREDFRLEVIGLADEWDTLSDASKNRILRRLVRRVALFRGENGPRIEVHPLWEPDPWEAEAGTPE